MPVDVTDCHAQNTTITAKYKISRIAAKTVTGRLVSFTEYHAQRCVRIGCPAGREPGTVTAATSPSRNLFSAGWPGQVITDAAAMTATWNFQCLIFHYFQATPAGGNLQLELISEILTVQALYL